MQLNTYIQQIKKVNPWVITPFTDDYFGWADMPGHNKPYFYGKWSVKWALWFIIEKQKPQPAQIRTLIHHLLCELAIHPAPEETAQFNAISLLAFLPWRQAMNSYKAETVNVKELPAFTANRWQFVVNHTPDNVTSAIFRNTRADAIVHINPETQAAAIIFRVNSAINHLAGFMAYIQNELFATEPGWKIMEGTTNKYFINHGIQSKTPTTHTPETLQQFIQNYFK